MSGTGTTESLDPKAVEKASETLGRYVYLLVDPRDGTPFYVGKGKGLRMLAHGVEAAAVLDGSLAVAEPEPLTREGLGRKVERIHAIQADGHEPDIWILRHGLSTEYTQVEAAVIDLLSTFPISTTGGSAALVPLGNAGQLTNARREASRGQGIVPLRTLIDELGAPPLATATPLLLITLGEWIEVEESLPGGGLRPGYGFKREWLHPDVRSAQLDALADSTRCWWKLSESRVRRQRISHAVAVYRGVTRALFTIDERTWQSGDGRRGFQAEAVTSGELWAAVVGPHGHRLPQRRQGDQSTIRYWPFAPRTAA